MSAEVIELCGIPVFTIERAADPLYANWPKTVCILPLGHESDHEWSRYDAVRWHWPVTEADVDILVNRRGGVIGHVG